MSASDRHVAVMTGELRLYSPCPGCRPLPRRQYGDPSYGNSAHEIREPLPRVSCGLLHETTVACPACGATFMYTLTWTDTDDYLKAACLCGETWTTPISPAQWDAGINRPQIPSSPADL